MSRELDLIILTGLFQLEIFCDFMKYIQIKIYTYIWKCMSKNNTLTPVGKFTYHSGSLWDIKANCTTVP